MQTSTPSEAPDASTRRTEISSHFSDLASVYHEKNYENPVERGQYPDILIRHEWFLKLVAIIKARKR